MLSKIFNKKAAPKPEKHVKDCLIELTQEVDGEKVAYRDPDGRRYFVYAPLAACPHNRAMYASGIATAWQCQSTPLAAVQLADMVLATFKKAAVTGDDVATLINFAAEIKATLPDPVVEGEPPILGYRPLLELAAIYCVREDEDPSTFSTKMLTEKVDYWMRHPETAVFFCQLALLITPNLPSHSDPTLLMFLLNQAEHTAKLKRVRFGRR